MVPVWEKCEICKQVGLHEAAGAPDDTPGWHTVLVTPEEAKQREDAYYGDNPG